MHKTWIRLFGAVLIAVLALPGRANVQGKFVLEKVFNVDADRARPASWARNGNVHEVQFSWRYNSDRCIGNYRVRFVFDRANIFRPGFWIFQGHLLS